MYLFSRGTFSFPVYVNGITMGLRLFYSESSWLREWKLFERRCNAWGGAVLLRVFLEGSLCLSLLSVWHRFSGLSRVAQLPLLPGLTGNSEQISPGINQSLRVLVSLSLDPKYSILLSLFIAFKFFSAQWRVFFRINLFVTCHWIFPITPSLSSQ